MATPKVIGRYEIVEELGRGAMGSVFKARDPIVGRLVALKTIHSAALEGAQADEYRARFQREARASGVLAHPGIVPVFDVGECDGAPFLVMEFVEGRTLDSAIKKGERFTLDRVCDMGQQLADALGYAHRQGVIHRDVKPANILLTSREVYGSERPRITDFGIAKLAASEITTTGQLLGTPAYMPPEQFTGAPIDGRADLFSLGVILYSLSTGEQPFPGETMTAVSYKVVYTEPIPPSKLNPGVSLELEAVILKCLAKSPATRYQTGEELAQDLAVLHGGTGTSGARVAAPMAVTPKLDPEATMAAAPSQISHPPAHPPAQAPAAATKKPFLAINKPVAGKKLPHNAASLAAMAAVVVLAAAAGGWYYLHHRIQPAPQPQPALVPAPQPPAPMPEPVPGNEPVTGQIQPLEPEPAATPKAAPAKPTAGKPAPAKPAATTKPAPAPTPAPVQPPTQPSVAAVPAAPQPRPTAAPPPAPAFDPRKGDPNTNAKLKIDLSKFPNGVQFTVEMNKKPYLSFTTGDGSSLDNLLVPPGVQAFHVILKSGGLEISSNIVSNDFKAKKKKTLKIQLKVQDQPVTNITLPIDKTATVFLSWGNIFTDL